MTDINRKTVTQKVIELYQKELEILPEDLGGAPVFDKPDVRIASAKDHVIEKFKTVIGNFHWSPDDALQTAFGCGNAAEAASVISWCLPVSEAARKSNRSEKYYPSRNWAWTRTFGENMNERMRFGLSEWLISEGHQSCAPAILNDFGFIEDTPVGIASPWSERHYAWAAGHGTFGISGGLITRRGIAHRLGSVVTALVLEPDAREYGEDPFAWCNNCRACIRRCPVGSIGRDHSERNKNLCDEHDMKRISAQYGILYEWKGIYGCGLCQTGVPCEYRKP